MSQHYVVIIPIDPTFIPSPKAAQVALDRLKKILPDAYEVTAELTDEIRFIPCVENFESAHCPRNGALIDMDAWRALMDKAWKSKFTDLTCLCPACGEKHSLNDLQYQFPQGFARFSLEARLNITNPSEEDFADFPCILGCPIRVIWVFT
jgi:hypothetical protein